MTHRLPRHVGRGVHMGVLGKLGQQRGFLCGVCQCDVDDVDGQQFGLVARIKAALVHGELGDGLRCNPQPCCGLGTQLGFGMVFGVVLGVV